MKIKAFGVLESLIASVILMLILSGATVLASRISKSVDKSQMNEAAAQLAQRVSANIDELKSTGNLFFDTRSALVFKNDLQDASLSIDCFDSSKITSCINLMPAPFRQRFFFSQKDQNAEGAFIIKSSDIKDNRFPDGFFTVKPKVSAFSCRTQGGLTIPGNKCRLIQIVINWQSNGLRSYEITKYVTDWQR